MPVGRQRIAMFIDYDNVDQRVRQRGVDRVVRAVLQQMPEDALPAGTEVLARLYGGWYDQHRLSPAARALERDIGGSFPSAVSLSTLGHRIRVSAELALALSISPAAELMNTYRVRGAPSSLRPRRYPFTGCARSEDGCPLRGTYELLGRKRCPEPECSARLRNVIMQPQQKLVDTMLTADLLYAAMRRPTTVIVASNDDDLWPAIHSAVNLGTTVHHVHPRAGRRTPEVYRSTVGRNYHQYSF